MTSISLISLMSQNPLGYHISEMEQVRHIVTINVRIGKYNQAFI